MTNGSVGMHDVAQAFLSLRPEWSLNGALLKRSDDNTARLTQTPFVWMDGAWETHVSIEPIAPSEGLHAVTLRARVKPDTLRRWAQVGINPFLEACAQLQEHWRRAHLHARETLEFL